MSAAPPRGTAYHHQSFIGGADVDASADSFIIKKLLTRQLSKEGDDEADAMRAAFMRAARNI